VRPFVDPRFAETLRRLRAERCLTVRELGRRAVYGKSYVHDLETGRKPPTLDVARRLDDALSADGALAAMVHGGTSAAVRDGFELDAVELARRVAASDVSAETLTRLEAITDDLAVAYPTTPPAELLSRVRQHVAYVGRLLDGRKTLDQHRRLLVIGGWLTLLASTLHIDLQHGTAAGAHLTTARELAAHAGHAEIAAWCLETRAWGLLTAGDYRRALDLSRQAQAVAPRGSSAHLQATAQEGRAWARMGDRRRTRATLDRLTRLTSGLSMPDRPEHHYRYDPQKAHSYAATTLAWVGDPAAEDYARSVLLELDATGGATGRPRRVANARLDLGLALLAAGRPDEATAAAVAAIASGRVVPSNWWRATEVVTGIERAGIAEARELREVYEAHRPDPTNDGA
jgi:transcriptional regulator with XRE-family HTH domain